MSKRFLKAFDRNRKPDLASVPEAVRDGFGYTKYLYRYAFDHMNLNTFGKQAFSESDNPQWHTSICGSPVLLADGHPDLARKTIRESMKCKCRNETDDPLWQTLRYLRQCVVSVKRRVGKLVEPAIKPKHLSCSLHAAHGRRSHASGAKFGKPYDSARLEQGMGNMALRKDGWH